jgi:hypothetical protein
LGRDVDLTVVDVGPLGDSPTQESDLEDPFEPGQALFEEELAVGDESGVVVDEAEQRGSAVLARALGVGQVGADEHVALPESVGTLSLESPEGFGLTDELLAGDAPLLEDAAESPGGEGEVGWIGRLAPEDLDDGVGGPGRDLLAQGDGLLDDILGNASGLASVGPQLRLEALEAPISVAGEVSPDRLIIEAGAGRVRDVMRLGGDGLEVSGDLAALEGTIEQRGDEGIAEEGNLGATLFLGWQRLELRGFHWLPPIEPGSDLARSSRQLVHLA